MDALLALGLFLDLLVGGAQGHMIKHGPGEVLNNTRNLASYNYIKIVIIHSLVPSQHN